MYTPSFKTEVILFFKRQTMSVKEENTQLREEGVYHRSI